MIGASGAAMGLASSPQASSLVGAAPAGESMAAPPDAAAAAPEGKGDEVVVASSHAKQAQPGPAECEGSGGGVAQDFATLLLAGTDAGTAAPLNTPAAPQESTQPEVVDATGLPDQMLALLDGSWMKFATPEPAGTSPATPAPSAWANPLPGATTQAAGAPAARDPTATLAAIAMPTQARATAPVDAAATIVLSADATAVTAAEGNSLAPSFPALMPPAATTLVERAIAAPPVTVPANPQGGFDDGFGARLVWMAEQRLGHAEIRLNPEHLGPIDVRVQVDGTQVSAEFHSGHAVVRQAIEASLPRLREMLEQQGMQLGQADVGQRHAGSGQPGRDGADAQSPVAGSTAADSRVATQPLRSRGLIDEYA